MDGLSILLLLSYRFEAGMQLGLPSLAISACSDINFKICSAVLRQTLMFFSVEEEAKVHDIIKSWIAKFLSFTVL